MTPSGDGKWNRRAHLHNKEMCVFSRRRQWKSDHAGVMHSNYFHFTTCSQCYTGEEVCMQPTFSTSRNSAKSAPRYALSSCYSGAVQPHQASFTITQVPYSRGPGLHSRPCLLTNLGSFSTSKKTPNAAYFSTKQPAINLYTPNVNNSWRTAPLTSKISFYIFIQQI